MKTFEEILRQKIRANVEKEVESAYYRTPDIEKFVDAQLERFVDVLYDMVERKIK